MLSCIKVSCSQINVIQSLFFLKKNFTTVFPAFYHQHFSEHMLMIALLIKPQKLKSTMMPVFIFVINFRNETAC